MATMKQEAGSTSAVIRMDILCSYSYCVSLMYGAKAVSLEYMEIRSEQGRSK